MSKPVIKRLARCVILLAASFWMALFLTQQLRHSGWYQSRMYRLLITGKPEQRLRAAGTLAVTGAEKQLLLALKVADPGVHDLARRALDHLWFNAAGADAYQKVCSAYDLVEGEKFRDALAILDRLVEQHPRFAEAWNRRASAHWKMGEYQKSLADCRRALALNPNHYGAWQGLGVCQLELGQLSEAVESLRAALRIQPHDAAARSALEKCEELLRRQTPAPAGAKDALLI
jgi:tetratricopeptide (TPR) repeat protein